MEKFISDLIETNEHVLQVRRSKKFGILDLISPIGPQMLSSLNLNTYFVVQNKEKQKQKLIAFSGKKDILWEEEIQEDLDQIKNLVIKDYYYKVIKIWK